MAGNGPPPAETRRRANTPARGDWEDLLPLKRPVLPALPKRTKAEGLWSARTRRVFEGWRRDPVTATFGKNEIASAIELAYLQEEVVRGKHTLASEVRQRADGLGLTPKGKRDLRYRVLFHPPAGLEPPPAKPRRPRRDDRRARLELVPS